MENSCMGQSHETVSYNTYSLSTYGFSSLVKDGFLSREEK